MAISPRVSIVMPAKDAALYITGCLDSIIAQTMVDWELWIVDDHSTDSTLALAQMYAGQDSRITVIPNRGKGIIPALQLASEHATGRYITRMDADDLMSPLKLSLMSASLERSGAGHVAVGLVQYFAAAGVGDGYQRYERWLNKLTSSASNFDDIYKECVIPSPCWMMAMQDFEVIGGFRSDVYPEDYELCFRMRASGLRVLPISAVLHYWRDHGDRASRNDLNYSDNRFLSLKCRYFISQDFNADKTLVLMGAGRKGKEVAKYLIDQEVQFRWMTNNPNKINRDIYNVMLQPESVMESLDDLQVIITVANRDEQDEITSRLLQRGLRLGRDYFRFC